MCTGRIDPAIVAGAFKNGLDGLLAVGCYFGDCHYITGNHQAKAKMDITRKLLKHAGLNEDRVAFRQCSSGEASVFVEIITELREAGHIVFATATTYSLAAINIARGHLHETIRIYQQAIQLAHEQGEPPIQGTADSASAGSAPHRRPGLPRKGPMQLARCERLCRNFAVRR